ncbi:MAG: 4Fe-4S binding protein [Slackia sp.]
MSAVSKKSIVGKFSELDSASIAVNQARCAKVRNRNVECLKCAQACTSGCISLVDGELVVDSSKCVGCGTCATICPTCALEARNPSDAELLNACLAARCGNSVEICCSQLAAALDGFIDKEKYAQVVCLGRVDETLICELAAHGVSDIHLGCGDCSACAQRFGKQTAETVAKTAEELFRAWNVPAKLSIKEGASTQILQESATDESAHERITRFFSEPKACATLESAKSEEQGPEDSSEAKQHQAFPLPHGKTGRFPISFPTEEKGCLTHFRPSEARMNPLCLPDFGAAWSSMARNARRVACVPRSVPREPFANSTPKMEPWA